MHNNNIITWLFLTRWGEKYIVLVQFCTIFDTKFVCLQTVKIHYLEWWPCGQGCELFLQSHATSRLPIFQAIGPPHPSLPLIHPLSIPLIPHTHAYVTHFLKTRWRWHRHIGIILGPIQYCLHIHEFVNLPLFLCGDISEDSYSLHRHNIFT